MPVFADEAKLKETANMRNIYEFMRKKINKNVRNRTCI